MRYRALTVSREYGSGGAEIARIISVRLGWKLVDEELLQEISRQAEIPLEDATTLDERVDPWIYRVVKPILGTGGDGISLVTPVQVFDAESMAHLTKLVIEAAYGEGNCVIVGRGAQCILHGKQDVFHAFAYAPWNDRAKRICRRVTAGADIGKLIRISDEQRLEYVRRHYGENRLNPHLYHLMVNTQAGCEATATMILEAMALI